MSRTATMFCHYLCAGCAMLSAFRLGTAIVHGWVGGAAVQTALVLGGVALAEHYRRATLASPALPPRGTEG